MAGRSVRVQGNLIGTDATGSYAVANGGDGLAVTYMGMGNTIGGIEPGAGNVISGNSGNGVVLSLGNRVQGNLIGVDATGVSPLGNGGDGVLVSFGPFANNTIGGTVAAAGNIIAYNGGDGVRVDFGTANAIRGNVIYAHSDGLGIALVHNGNNNQPAPVVTDAQSDHAGTTVMGTFTGQANTLVTLEFFSNAVCNPSGYGEGEVFLGTLAVMTNATGNASFTARFGAGVGPRRYIAATATDPNGNTSAFSRCLVARRHGHLGGNTDRAEAPGNSMVAVFRLGIGSHSATGVSMVLTDPSRESVDRDEVLGMVAGDANQVPTLPVAGAWRPTRFGADLFFSGLGWDGVDGLVQHETVADPLRVVEMTR